LSDVEEQIGMLLEKLFCLPMVKYHVLQVVVREMDLAPIRWERRRLD